MKHQKDIEYENQINDIFENSNFHRSVELRVIALFKGNHQTVIECKHQNKHIKHLSLFIFEGNYQTRCTTTYASAVFFALYHH